MTTLTDLEVLAHLEQECFPDPWSERALTEALQNQSYLVIIARDAAGEPLGYLIGWQTGGEAELARIGVASAARRLGHGRDLLDDSLTTWRDKGVSRVFLEVRESNIAARLLYESRGFLIVGRRSKYYPDGTDALVLSLEMPGN